MNISIVKLGHEECEICVSTKEHHKISGHDEKHDSALIKLHLNYVNLARLKYRADGNEMFQMN